MEFRTEMIDKMVSKITAQNYSQSRCLLISHSNDNIKSVSTLNKGIYHNYFMQTHAKSVELVNTLMNILYVDHHDLSQIHNITKLLQLNELFSSKLPVILSTIYHDHNDVSIRSILNAMNMHSMDLSELHKMMNTTNPYLSILILSSRALINYYVFSDGVTAPNITLTLNLIRLPGHPRLCRIINEFPWIVDTYYTSFLDALDSDFIWAIYFTYLYEHIFEYYHKELILPTLNTIFDKDKIRERMHLIQIIESFGFVVWNKQSILYLRNDFFFRNYGQEISLIDYVLEADRINDILFVDNGVEFTYQYEFMTQFILDLIDKYNVTKHYNTSSLYQMRAVVLAADVIRNVVKYNYDNAKYDTFERLVRLMIDTGYLSCMHFIGVRQIMYFAFDDDDYFFDIVYVLWKYKPNLMYRALLRKGITIFIRCIIRQSKEYWFQEKNGFKAMKEISKLAMPPLFPKSVIQILKVECTECRNESHIEYLSIAISTICKIRNDCNYNI